MRGTKVDSIIKRPWPVAGFILGVLIAAFHGHSCLSAGEAAGIWLLAVMAVLSLSMFKVGRFLAVLGSGAMLAVPSFICGLPLTRCLFFCLMALLFVTTCALTLAPPLVGFRVRLRHVMSWCDTRDLSRSPHRVEWKSLTRLLLATLFCGVALSTVPRAGNYVTRWLSGGVAALAFAEMITMAFVVLTGLTGVSAPLIMESPHLARTLAEFWSRRWNPGTSELLFRRHFFNPFARRGPALAMVNAFAFSGLFHSALIYVCLGNWRMSLMGGAFFMVQPVFVAAERRLRVRSWRPVAAHAWTIGVLAVTSPLLIEPVLQLIEGNGENLNAIVPVTAIATAIVIALSGMMALLSIVALPTRSDDAA